MPRDYRHLAHEERCQMHALIESRLSDGAIGQRLGRDRTMVWRERPRCGNGRCCASEWKWGDLDMLPCGRIEVKQLRNWVNGESNSLKKSSVSQKISSLPFAADEKSSVDFQRLSF